MAKYAIVIETLDLESAPAVATGTCSGKPFEARTIPHGGQMIWKILEHGMLPCPLPMSGFEAGERSSVARWLKKVEVNPELIGKNSQTAGYVVSASPKTAALKAENDELKQRLERMEAMMARLLGDESAEDQDEDSEE